MHSIISIVGKSGSGKTTLMERLIAELKKRGRKVATNAELEAELAKLRGQNQQLQTRLEQAETIIEVQKKLSQLLGLAPGEKEGSK